MFEMRKNNAYNKYLERVVLKLKLKMNVDLNIKNQKWSSISKHVDREHESYSNQNIQQNLSSQNIDLSTKINPQQVIKNHYAPYINRHDRPIKLGKSRAKPYKSVSNYLKRRRATPETTWVVKLGTDESNKKLLKQIQDSLPVIGAKGVQSTRKRAIELKAKADNLGLSYYVKGFNDRNKYLKLCHAETNIDETSPHVHMQVIPLGFSRSKRFGKTPSASMTKALELEFNDKNNQVATHHLHQFEDPKLIKSMSKAYSQVFNEPINFVLTRNKSNGFSGMGEKHFETLKKHEDMVVAKAKHRQELAEKKADDAFQSLQLQLSSLSQLNDKLISQNKSLKTANQSWSRSYSHLNDKYTSMKSGVQSLKNYFQTLKVSLMKPKSSSRDWLTKLVKDELGNVKRSNLKD